MAAFIELRQSFFKHGYAVLAVAYAMGLGLGSLAGGTLARPHNVFGLPSDSLLGTRKYLLPCLVTAGVSLIGLVLVSLVLVETYLERGTRRGSPSTRERSHSTERRPLLAEVDDNDEHVSDASLASLPPPRPSTMRVISQLSGRVWLVCIINGLLGFAYNGFSEIFPLWAKTAPKRWGLGFQPLRIGVAHAISGPVAAGYQLLLYRRIVAAVGGVGNMLRLTQIVLLLLTLLFPLQNLLVEGNVYLFWFVMVVAQSLKAVGFSGSFTSMYVLVNSTASSIGGSNAGVINGLGQALENVGRLLAPAVMGGIYYWALPEKFPTNPFAPYALLAFVMLLIALLTGFAGGNDIKQSADEKFNINGERNDDADELVLPFTPSTSHRLVDAASDAFASDRGTTKTVRFYHTVLDDVPDSALVYSSGGKTVEKPAADDQKLGADKHFATSPAAPSAKQPLLCGVW